jgi:hypothetical protein
MHKRSKETKNLSRVDIFTVKEWIQKSQTDWNYHKKGTKVEWRKLEEMNQWGL